MSRKPKFENESKSRPGKRRQSAPSAPPVTVRGSALAKKLASEAPTEPPPAPRSDEAVEILIPKDVKPSRVRPKRGVRAATVDEVTADMTKDPRREE